MVARFRIGLRLDPPLGSKHQPVQAGRELVAILAAIPRMETLGFDSLWIAEGPGSATALVPSALVLAAAAIQRTRRLRVVTGLLPLPLYHPVRVAEDGATLDGLSGGRFELGVGMGSDSEALVRFGLHPRVRLERFEEALDLIGRVWSEEPADFAGRHFRIHGLRLHPRPLRQGGPPLWIGASAAAGQRRAAQRGAGLVLRPGVRAEAYLAAWPLKGAIGPRPRIALLAPTPSWDRSLRDVEGEAREGGAELEIVLPFPECGAEPGASARLEAALAALAREAGAEAEPDCEAPA